MSFAKINHLFGEPLLTSSITIPEDYCFENQIDNFIKNVDASIHLLGNALSDKNFSSVSNILIPGKKYKFEILPIIEYIGHCSSCLTKLKERKVLLIGAQGLLLFYEQVQKFHIGPLPMNTKIFSFDERGNLYKYDGEGSEQVPYIYYVDRPELSNDPVYGKFKLEVSTINFWSSLPSRGTSVLCFYDEN